MPANTAESSGEVFQYLQSNQGDQLGQVQSHPYIALELQAQLALAACIEATPSLQRGRLESVSAVFSGSTPRIHQLQIQLARATDSFLEPSPRTPTRNIWQPKVRNNITLLHQKSSRLRRAKIRHSLQLRLRVCRPHHLPTTRKQILLMRKMDRRSDQYLYLLQTQIWLCPQAK